MRQIFGDSSSRRFSLHNCHNEFVVLLMRISGVPAELLNVVASCLLLQFLSGDPLYSWKTWPETRDLSQSQFHLRFLISHTHAAQYTVWCVMQAWGVVRSAQLICRPGSHPDIHRQGEVVSFPLPYTIRPPHPQHARPPCWQSQGFSQTINCPLSLRTHTLIRKEKKKIPGRYDFTGSFPPLSLKQDDTTLGNKHFKNCVCSLKGLVFE